MEFGVDEAGKGPALGSMFAAAVAVPDPAVLPADVGDSKGIAHDRRTEMARELRTDDRIGVGVGEIPPSLIDDPETNMNALTVRAQVRAIRDLNRSLADGDLAWSLADDGAVGYLDAGDVDAGRFARRVRDRLDAAPELRAEHGADETYAVVGAASVVAKVCRDDHVADLATEYGEVGSGYPSDPTTREFLRSYLEEHGDLPDCARTSWSTCQDLLADARQSGLDDF